jgi:hypothetical protein
MSFMSPRSRARLLWLLAAVTAAYALVNVVVYYATGRFGSAWFATSLLVYGALLVAALALAVTDPGQAVAAAQAGRAGPEASRLLARDVLYATKTGYLLRLTYLRPDGEREARLFLCEGGASTPLPDAEAWIDALPPAEPSPRLLADTDAALAARIMPAPARSSKVIP